MLGPLDLSRKRQAPAAILPPGVPSIDGLAARPAIREALQFFAREKRWIDEQHLALCRIPALTFREAQRAEWVAAQFRSYGLDARLDRAGNVLAFAGDPGRNAPIVAVTAHLDTVLAPDRPEDVRIDGNGRFLGPGVSDNGSGLAGLLALARVLTLSPALDFSPASLLLVANVGEEGEGNLSGMRFLCRQSPYAGRIRSFLVLDGPATDHITSEALACRRFEISVHGPGGHSWSDHGTANPVHALSRAIAWFADARAVATPPVRCSWNFGVIEGGSTVNAIPTTARAKVDLRSSSPEFLDALAAELASVVERALLAENEIALAGRVSAKLKETGSRPGGVLPAGAPILDYIRAVDRHLGIRSLPDCASTDANVPLSLGLPAISIGAGGSGGGAHTPSEWYSPEGRDLGLRRVLLFLCLLLADAGWNASS